MGTTATFDVAGRSTEQHLLKQFLRSKRPEFILIYGRRRVGKTYLVRNFFAGRCGFFEMTGRAQGGLADHLRIFAECLSRAFSPGVQRVPPRDWHAAFAELRAELLRRRSRKKIVLFFDELPWMATQRSGCLQELEFFWNTFASRRPEVILIVCGSAASWMLRKIVHARGGLHNRLTHSLRLDPFELAETHSLTRALGLDLTQDEVLEGYLSLGGVPHYWSLLDRSESIAQNVERLIINKNGPLHREFDNVFRSLFKRGDVHRRIVEILAPRRSGIPLKTLLVKARLSSGGGAKRRIEELEEAGFIETATPFGRRSRDRVARVVDEFTLFANHWLKTKRVNTWTQRRGTPAWRSWAGLSFEALCLKHQTQIKDALGIAGVFSDASSWRTLGSAPAAGAQVDLLFDRADNVISLCEIKHTEAPFAIDKRYAAELRRKMAVFREQTKTTKALRLVIVSAHGMVENKWSRNLVDSVVTLKDLFRPRR